MSVLSKGDENHLYVFNKYATREKCSINNKNQKDSMIFGKTYL